MRTAASAVQTCVKQEHQIRFNHIFNDLHGAKGMTKTVKSFELFAFEAMANTK